MGVEKLENLSLNEHSATLSVYGYTDYRAYLRAYYEFRKSSHRGYSFRAFSKAGGFAAPNILKLVMDGERNLGPEAIEQFVTALRLAGNMAEYFRTLVRMNQSKSDEEKEQWYGRLAMLTPHGKRRDLNPEAHQYLSHWLYPVLREMIALPDFSSDPYWIARRLNHQASPNEIASALQFLLREGFIEKTADGRFEARENMVLTSDEVRSLSIRNYHRQMLERAREALEVVPMEEREFGALTLMLPETAIEELKSRLKAFRRDLHQWAMQASDASPGNVVVQVNFQAYPHTRRVTRDGNE